MLRRILLAPRIQFRKIQTVFEEEYYEEVVYEKKQPIAPVPEISSIPSTSSTSLSDIRNALIGQKARDLFIIRNDLQMSPYDYKIICSTYNSRQAAAISENLRKLLKMDGDLPMSQSKTITKRSNGWYVAEVGQIQIHVMSEECREKYDLETVWAGDEKLRECIENQNDDFMLPPRK